MGKVQSYLWDGNASAFVDGTPDDATGLQYYLQDDLGSPIRLADAGGGVIQSYGYDEFGQDLYGNGGMIQPFGFTGYEPDAIAGTAFAQAREDGSGTFYSFTGTQALSKVLIGKDTKGELIINTLPSKDTEQFLKEAHIIF